MRKNNGASKTMYCISRIDDDTHRTHAWRVSMCRRGKRYVKNFSDKKLGGKQIALSEAKRYRDQLLLQHAPISRQEFSVSKRRNNTSGITGVYTYAKRFKRRDGSINETWYWEAHWPTQRGESAHECFSVREYGEEVARQMAIRARERGLRKVEGLFWASERGDTSEKMPISNGVQTSRTTESSQTPPRDGSKQVAFEPIDFVASLAVLEPKPRMNLAS